uniref:Ectoine hydroxylase-like 033 n=1 Tax=Saccoglossus kowalevskii TaxID=10224 RepID=A0A0U2UZ29_SACKO|nr:PREDICTED: uncharacterized protein LOC100369088 [Saccoglossus kowalevskii]ALR88595.1 ectoine hydroxylase-like 033 [Saccoglossus kowalevskii]
MSYPRLFGSVQRVLSRTALQNTRSSTIKGTSLLAAVSRRALSASVVTDHYPTRKSVSGLYPRVDPWFWEDKNGVRPTGPITDAQLKEYDEKGYFVMPNFFSQEEIQPVIDAIYKHKNAIESSLKDDEDPTLTPEISYSTEPGTKRLRSQFGLHRQMPELNDILKHKRIIQYVRQILADDVYIHQDLVNFHTAFTGIGHNWHSDFEFFHAEDGMPNMRAMFCSIMLTKNTPDRGATMVIPGTHKIFVGNPTETPKNQLGTSSKYKIEAGETDQKLFTDLANKYGIEYLVGDAGSVVFCDINVLHGNHTNMSPWDRLNLLPVYNSISNKVGKPFSAPWERRPEYIATRNKENITPIPYQ